MERYSLQEARDHLQQLIGEALHGKKVLIVGKDEQAVQLVPVPAAQKPRKAGSAHGLVLIGTDFDAPLSDFDEYQK